MRPRRASRATPAVEIRSTCPTCGDVDLTGSDLVVRVCSVDKQGSYAFRCPSCCLAVAKPAAAAVVDLLASSGVRVVVWDLPAEMAEVHSGPPITYDDVLELHYALCQPGWLERVVSGNTPT